MWLLVASYEGEIAAYGVTYNNKKGAGAPFNLTALTIAATQTS